MTTPTLVTIKQAASTLGVSRQRAQVLLAREGHILYVRGRMYAVEDGVNELAAQRQRNREQWEKNNASWSDVQEGS